jgi:ariadne-1
VAHSIADNIAGSAPSDDDMDMEFADDFKVPQHSPRKAYEIEHESLSQQEVEKLSAADVDHISSIFGVDVCMNVLSLISY